jgi:hypothetical protein
MRRPTSRAGPSLIIAGLDAHFLKMASLPRPDAPRELIGPLRGDNFGKTLIRVSPDPTRR